MTAWKTMDTCPADKYVLMTNGRVTTTAKFEVWQSGRKHYDVDGAGGYECDYDFNMDPPAYWMELPQIPADAEAVSRKAAVDGRDDGTPDESQTPMDPGVLTDFLEYLKPRTLANFKAIGPDFLDRQDPK